MAYQHILLPDGEPIRVHSDCTLSVPDRPIIPFIKGDGIGVDITPVMCKVVDAAVDKAYEHTRAIAWMEAFAGERAVQIYGPDQWLPEETLQALKSFVVSIKGPLTTPVGGGMRSLNVTIRQRLDLYACVRPIRYFPGTPSPLKDPSATNMVIFRENTEDIYAGIEWAAGSQEVKRMLDFLIKDMQVTTIRFPETSAIGIKPVSKEGSARLVRKAIQYTIDNHRQSVTLVHKGNIMKYTEGAFRNWGYEVAQREFGAQPIGEGPWCRMINPKAGTEIIIKDVIADNFLQQALLKPKDYDVIATLNLNGDYISDALAAQVGGIGIAPGANIADAIGVFEATHGTAPKHAGQNKANPGSIILSAEMMLRYIGWSEAADLVLQGMRGAIRAGTVTYDFARALAHENGQAPVTPVTSSAFGDAIVHHMTT